MAANHYYRITTVDGVTGLYHGEVLVWSHNAAVDGPVNDEDLQSFLWAVLNDHQWQDTGFPDVEDCAVPDCRVYRSRPGD